MRPKFDTLLFIIASCLVAGQASAVTLDLCVSVEAEFNDNSDNFDPQTSSIREDYYLNDGQLALRGAYVTVKNPSTLATYFSGFLGDGLNGSTGCTSVTYPGSPASWLVTVYTQGQVNTHDISVIDHDTGNYASLSSTVAVPPSGTVTLAATPVVDSSTERGFDAYLAATLAMFRHSLGTSGANIEVRFDDEGGNVTESGSGSFDARVRLSEWGAKRKFVVAHEMGHALLKYRIGSSKAFGDCSTSLNASCPASSQSHSMASREYSSCAFAESFAHFYATDAFNSHSSEEATFNYYKDEFGSGFPTIDIEHGAADNSVRGPFPVKYMETFPCGIAISWPGRGVELDWLRTWWDMHADTTTPISMNTITSWLAGAGSWSNTSTFTTLDSAANSIGGSLNSSWDLYSAANGIDH